MPKSSRLLLVVSCCTALLTLVDAACQRASTPHHGLIEVPIVYPVTVDSLLEVGRGAELVLHTKGVRLRALSAEGDPARFSTVVEAALSQQPPAIIAVGTQIANTLLASKYQAIRPPIIASAIFEPTRLEGLSRALERPRALDLAVVSDQPLGVGAEMAVLIHRVLPTAKIVGILTNKGEENSYASADTIAIALRTDGFDVQFGFVSSPSDLSGTTRALLLRGVQVIVIPHDKIAVSQAASVVGIALVGMGTANVPVLSLDDGTVTKHGVLACVSADYEAVGRHAGQLVADLLDGKSLRDVPIVYPSETKVLLNRSTAARLGLALPRDLGFPSQTID